MRTTLTLDDDLAAALKEMAFTRQESLKQVVNEAIRAGLRAKAAPPAAKSYSLQPAALGRVAPGIDLDRALRLADDLEDEGLVGKIEARK
ncbi:MAG: ribbon-helix-helix protein, CopG family [Acidobacteria bacterium]|nr:ribbon-helix-helix protein, CopG family [Acidobacteriota bacterium]